MEPVKRDSTADQCYDILRKGIYDGSFAPGEKLDMMFLTRSLGVSKTPIKEAVKRLEWDGLVEVRHREGTFVANPGLGDFLEALDTKIAMVSWLVRRTVELLTPEARRRLSTYVEILAHEADWMDHSSAWGVWVSVEHTLTVFVANQTLIDQLQKMNAILNLARQHGHRPPSLTRAEAMAVVNGLKDADADIIMPVLHRLDADSRDSLRRNVKAGP